MEEYEKLRAENDKLQAQIEQQLKGILDDIEIIKNNLQGK